MFLGEYLRGKKQKNQTNKLLADFMIVKLCGLIETMPNTMKFNHFRILV